MSKRPPYPFAALEAKWRRIWDGAPLETTAELGQVGSTSLRIAWVECLAKRTLRCGFPGALEGGDGWIPHPTEFGRDGCRVALLSRPGELPGDRPSSEELTAAARLLGRVWRLYVDETDTVEFQQTCTLDPTQSVAALEGIGLSSALGPDLPSLSMHRAWHSCLQRVEQGIAQQRPHIAVAALSEFVNQATLWPKRPQGLLTDFLQVLQPFAPILAQELTAKCRSNATGRAPHEPVPVRAGAWPVLDSKCLTGTALEISIQINGKAKDTLMVSADVSPAALEKAALSAEKVVPFLQGKVIRRVVVVPQKLVNIAVE